MLLLLCDKKNNPNTTIFVMLGNSELPCSIDPYESSDNVLFKISENQFLKYKVLQQRSCSPLLAVGYGSTSLQVLLQYF